MVVWAALPSDFKGASLQWQYQSSWLSDIMLSWWIRNNAVALAYTASTTGTRPLDSWTHNREHRKTGFLQNIPACFPGLSTTCSLHYIPGPRIPMLVHKFNYVTDQTYFCTYIHRIFHDQDLIPCLENVNFKFHDLPWLSRICTNLGKRTSSLTLSTAFTLGCLSSRSCTTSP